MVKPPSRPVMRRGDSHCGCCSFCHAKSKPITKHPRMLQANTPMGNLAICGPLLSQLLRPKRSIAPNPPPIKM